MFHDPKRLLFKRLKTKNLLGFSIPLVLVAFVRNNTTFAPQIYQVRFPSGARKSKCSVMNMLCNFFSALSSEQCVKQFHLKNKNSEVHLVTLYTCIERMLIDTIVHTKVSKYLYRVGNLQKLQSFSSPPLSP